jgi:hypothetical protein
MLNAAPLRPWTYEEHNGRVLVLDPDDRPVAEIGPHTGPEQPGPRTVAANIVDAVNTHAALVSVCTALLARERRGAKGFVRCQFCNQPVPDHPGWCPYAQARAALAQVGAVEPRT